MAMDIDSFFQAELNEHARLVEQVRDAVREPFMRLVDGAVDAIRAGGKIVFFGNGGSAADAQHLATELAVRCVRDRPPIAGLALTTDTSALTAIGNDYGFDQLFARQITALCGPADLCIGISTSGNSENVIQGLLAGQRIGCRTAGLSGRDGGRMVQHADPLLIVPCDNTARIQEMHITLGHMLCIALEMRLELA